MSDTFKATVAATVVTVLCVIEGLIALHLGGISFALIAMVFLSFIVGWLWFIAVDVAIDERGERDRCDR